MIPDEPVDLEPLGDFLDSARAPEACMDLSELDGFLAGLAVGPDPVLPEEWLPMVWDDEDPEFEDQAEADMVLGTMFARYNEISDGLDTEEPGYDPVYWQDATGRTVVEDWTVGFMRAVGFSSPSWRSRASAAPTSTRKTSAFPSPTWTNCWRMPTPCWRPASWDFTRIGGSGRRWRVLG
jgi:uncharacterized protein